jgi:predicted esterase
LGLAKGIVIGGYSMGGMVAGDIATRYMSKGIGSIVIVGSTLFDNGPGLKGGKDLGGTRIRHVVGKDDIWFPPGNAGKQLEKLQRKYNLTKV